MENLRQIKRLAICLLLLMSGLPSLAFAGGFQLYEENVTNMGNAYAGTGAEASDASTEFYNPAGMVMLDNPQFVLGASAIDVDIDSTVNSATSTTTLTLPTIIGPVPVTRTSSITGTANTSPGSLSGVPLFHFVWPFNHTVAVGFGVTAPFGLLTDYPQDSLSRFLATKSEVLTLNMGPSVAVQILPRVSVGAGVDWQYLNATFDQMVLPSFTQGAGIPFYNSGDDWALGWHAGGLIQISPTTRVGASYHSEMHYEITGSSSLSGNISTTGSGFPLPPITLNESLSGQFKAGVTLPDYADLSYYQQLTQRWAVLASLDYTHWSTIQTLIATFSGSIANSVQATAIPLALKDTYRLSLGLNYKPAQKWLLRTGIAYDQSPVSDMDSRTYRLPDADRYWLSFGGRYIINKRFTLDAGYSHLFIHSPYNANSTVILDGQLAAGGLVLPVTDVENAMGSFSSSVNEVGLQLTWNVV